MVFLLLLSSFSCTFIPFKCTLGRPEGRTFSLFEVPLPPFSVENNFQSIERIFRVIMVYLWRQCESGTIKGNLFKKHSIRSTEVFEYLLGQSQIFTEQAQSFNSPQYLTVKPLQNRFVQLGCIVSTGDWECAFYALSCCSYGNMEALLSFCEVRRETIQYFLFFIVLGKKNKPAVSLRCIHP